MQAGIRHVIFRNGNPDKKPTYLKEPAALIGGTPVAAIARSLESKLANMSGTGAMTVSWRPFSPSIGRGKGHE
jgi:hypothetical protein